MRRSDDLVEAMTKRNGARPKRRRTRRVESASADERPQGFQPERMRALWENIDHARAKLAPESADTPSAPATSLLSWVVPARVLELAPCALLARATGWIVRLPGLDWLAALWRSSPSR